MAVDFYTTANPPSEQQIINDFWASVDSSISYLQVDTLSQTNKIIMGMVRGNTYLWGSIASFGQNLTNVKNATSPWLDIIALGFYDLTRIPVSPTIGGIIIGSGTSSTPTAGTTVVLQNPQTGVTYVGVFTSTTTLTTFTAQTTGTIGDCSYSALVSTNPAAYSISTTNVFANATSWITYHGTAAESDSHLIQRCLDQVSMQSAGFVRSIAAWLRTSTNNQIWRVLQPIGSQTVYVAGATGPAPPAWQTQATSSAIAYSPPSSSPTVVGCATPITQQNISIVGNLRFPPGTASDVVQLVLQGLSDWINTLPINDGSANTQLYLATIERKILSLDSTQSCIPTIYVFTNGSNYVNLSDPISASIGSIFVANLTNLQVVYQ
jgi:hypothetical protein